MRLTTASRKYEPAHLTLQDRLVKKLRLRGISDAEAANAFAPEFIADYNRRFARAARSEHDAHLPPQPSDDLARIFSWQESRLVSKSLPLNYKRVLYVLDSTDAARAAREKRVGIEKREDGSLSFWHGEHELLATAFPKEHGPKSTRAGIGMRESRPPRSATLERIGRTRPLATAPSRRSSTRVGGCPM